MISDLGFRREVPKISHNVGNFFFLNEALLLVVEEREGFLDLGFEVLLEFGLLRVGCIGIPEHEKRNRNMIIGMENSMKGQ